jgi:hypothetical protein
LYDAESDGSKIGASSTASVAVTNGYFKAVVNAANEFGASAYNGDARWLEITVQCLSDMLPVKLSPRQAVTLAPYAGYSLNADTVDGSHASAFAASTQPGFVGGAADGVDLTGKIPLAVAGIVPVKVSAENGAIQPGDLLVSSTIAGHAMRAGDGPPVGTVIGKAMQPLPRGVGVILVLVILQ